MASYFTGLMIRVLILGSIVYLAASHVPNIPLTPQVRLLIALLVVVTYGCLDFLREVLITSKDKVCDAMC
uniref:Uncharacterized protein n=1 Tax=viral metagenome TaxID=1070528 RepID=A0A6C0BLK0_9ZZZZ